MRRTTRWAQLWALVLGSLVAIDVRADDTVAGAPQTTESSPEAPPHVTGPAAGATQPAERLELRRVDSRLAILENERARHRLTGPVFATGISLGLATWGGVYTAVDGPSGIVLTGAVLSLLAGAGGAAILVRRVRLRRQHLPEIRELRERQHHLEREILYGWAVDPVTRSVHLGVRF